MAAQITANSDCRKGYKPYFFSQRPSADLKYWPAGIRSNSSLAVAASAGVPALAAASL